ncbi:MAG TPA: FecR domain-containing protein [Puia sp.]|nr:FecR domain-containing protein [Puia sp.]
MAPLHQYDNIPWELIGSALEDRLSPDEALELREWLASSPDNQQTFTRLQTLWKESLSDYEAWRQADEVKAWGSVRQRIGAQGGIGEHEGASRQRDIGAQQSSGAQQVLRPDFRKAKIRIIQMAAAAIVLLTIGATWWYRTRMNHPFTYVTADNEQRKIALPDGSTVVIDPNTLLRVAADYNNKGGRTVSLAAGQASFEVSHQAQVPFQVDMDAVSVKDIGTSFTIHRTKEKIEVRVTSGKVAFIKKENGESRELAAGSSMVFYVLEKRFGEVETADSAGGSDGSRRYVDAPLKEVIAALERSSGKKITPGDGVTGQERLTIDIRGESVENSLKIICASLDLEYIEDNGGYILKKKATR